MAGDRESLTRPVFEYRPVEVEPLRWPELGGRLAEAAAARAAAAGGMLYGVWVGQIGLARDEGIVMTAWPNLDAARRHGAAAVVLDGVASGEPTHLEATVRPTSDRAPRRPGFYAHRWFELPVADWPEFLELSHTAWPAMEAAVDAQILGFWRDVDTLEGDTARVLLLTRYATLDDWERSRWWGRPVAAAAPAIERFRRRAALVRRTRVVISTLPPSWVEA